MIFGIYKEDILKPLDRLSKLISNKSSIPVLDCVKFDIYGNTAFLTAGNDGTKMSIKTSVTQIDNQDGGFCVNLKTFQELLRKMPDTGLGVTFKEEERVVEINFNTGKTNLPTTSVDEYPSIENSDSEGILIDKDFTRKLDKAFNFTADDELRPVMNGVYFDTINGNIVGANIHTMYKCSELPKSDEVKPFILTKDAHKAIKGLSNYAISTDDRIAYIKGDNFLINSRLIEGRFPNYLAVIPENPIEYIVDRESMLNSISRSLLCSNEDTSLVELTMGGGNIVLNTKDLDLNKKFTETIPCQGDQDGTIGLKGTLASLCLSNIDSDMVLFTYADKSRPSLFKPISGEDESLSYDEVILLMPMLI